MPSFVFGLLHSILFLNSVIISYELYIVHPQCCVVFSCMNIPQFINPTVNGHRVVPKLRLLQIILLWTFLSHFFWRIFYRFLWGRKRELGPRIRIYPAVVDITSLLKWLSQHVLPTGVLLHVLDNTFFLLNFTNISSQVSALSCDLNVHLFDN